ncbi:MAG: hypothetical protein IPP15_05055 [Saprospiraceae bacterium]|uniref:Uncharacterized protein n=1 Tax=Candidatus Opimibacter skivensis TaxID=2982028 RepID=A0A9D7SRL6_9BACT|nr:hypothetical protein [Candidatus Opimibacter skivensis]
MIRKYSSVILTLLCGVLLSISTGLYNNFPITYPDSAAYLASGIENSLPRDRPIFYGWFLRHTHMMDNLVFSIIAQGILASVVLFLFFHYFSRYHNKLIHFLLSVFVLCCFTGYSYFVSFLMPDIFTSIFLISLALIFFADLKKAHLWFLLPVCVYATIVHNSHFPLFLLCLLFLGGRYVIWNKSNERPYFLKKWILSFSVFITAVVITFVVNFAFTQRLFLSQNGHVFLTSRLHEMGILDSFLNEKCSQANYALCPYKDSMTADFIWDSKSPFYKTGGWETSGPAYNRMIHDIMWNGKYLKRFVSASFSSTLSQLASFEIEPQRPNILSYINERFPALRNAQSISFQNRGNGRLSFDKLNERQNILVFGSFAMLVLLLLFYKKWTGRHRELVVLFLWAMLFNAFICSTFSTVLTRYQGRVIFLVPLVFLLLLPSLDFRSFFRPPVEMTKDE